MDCVTLADILLASTFTKSRETDLDCIHYKWDYFQGEGWTVSAYIKDEMICQTDFKWPGYGGIMYDVFREDVCRWHHGNRWCLSHKPNVN